MLKKIIANGRMNWKWILVFIFIFIFFLTTYETSSRYKGTPTLENDGFILLNNPNKNEVLRHLPDGYEFLDYRYTIEGCTLSTFHRDVTSSQTIFNTKHPVYTLITYDYDGTSLSVCPGSHKTTPFLFTTPVPVSSNAVLFNCDLVHAGGMNLEKKPRRAVQYKVVHRDDKEKLSHLNGIDTLKTGDCSKRNNIFGDMFYRKLSIFFSYIINHQLTPYLQNRENNIVCKILGEDRCFYNM